MPRIGFVPLDDRPCTRDFPNLIAKIASSEVRQPPRENLGHFLTPGQPDLIGNWLHAMAKDLDYLIVSIDMLTYGGLIASRTPEVSKGLALERLDVLRQLKKLNPALQIYAWNVLMRISITVHDDQTATYWEQMNRFSVLWAQDQEGTLPEQDRPAFLRLKEEIPARVQDAYFQARERNHAVNQHSISLVDKGIIDVLILCQEDAHPIGPHKIEQRKLLKNIRTEDLQERIFLHPGADESGLNLLARAFCHHLGQSPTIIHDFFPESAKTSIPIFEDIPLGQSIVSQSLACGLVVNTGKPDLWGAVYGPDQTAHGLEVWQRKEETPLAEVVLRQLWTEVTERAEEGVHPLLLDVRSPNGSDPTLLEFLKTKKSSLLASYAGWNTAGNTIGTALAQGTIYAVAKSTNSLDEKAQIEFLIARLLDDYVYQKIIRDELGDMISQSDTWGTRHYLTNEGWEALNAHTEERLQEWADQWLDKYGLPCVTVRAKLPWPRIFEVEVMVELKRELKK